MQQDKNLENVTHEEAVATLKSIIDKATLVIQKQQHPIMASPALSQFNSHSTGAVNNIGNSVVDFGSATSPGGLIGGDRSHSPLPRVYILFSKFILYNFLIAI